MLSKVKRPDSAEVTFKYDALGRRIEKRFNRSVTRWVWDGNVPLHEWREIHTKDYEPEKGYFTNIEKQPVTTWIFEEGTFVPTAKLTESRKLSIVANYMGTPEAMYDSEGRKSWSCELNSYGKVRNFEGEYKTDCPFRYQGQYEDAETGLYYNRFRYYSPDEGIYISQDPIRLDGGLSLYSFVVDTNFYIDLLGLTPLVSNAPSYSGIYHIQGADGRTYVGSAVDINARLDSNSHPTATDIINSGDYKITYYEVDLGTASGRKEIDHVLRHHEQQIMDQNKYVPGENGNMNKNRPEAKKKNARNKAEVEKCGAGFTEGSKKKLGGSLCNG